MEQTKILAFCFHSIFKNEAELEAEPAAGQQALTLEQFKTFLAEFEQAGLEFLSPASLTSDAPPSGHYVLLTFDDTYYNQRRVLPLLEDYRAPALFFTSPAFIRDSGDFWWNVIRRAGRRQNHASDWISEFIEKCKELSPIEIREAVTDEFGEVAFQAASEQSRPFTAEELRDFADDDYVWLANHTFNHRQLTGCPAAEIRGEIERANAYLEEVSGFIPGLFAYPFGEFDDRVVETLAGLPVEFAFTIRGGSFELPPAGETSPYRLPRYLLWGREDRSIKQQCRSILEHEGYR